MIALDTTFLIDLYWLDSPRHKSAVELFKKLSDEKNESYKEDLVNDDILVYYNCFNEFVHVITDSRRFENAMSMKTALEICEQWKDLERIKIVFPNETSFVRTLTCLSLSNLGRNRLNDTNMVSCYISTGATKIVTANPKDFEIFPEIECMGY